MGPVKTRASTEFRQDTIRPVKPINGARKSGASDNGQNLAVQVKRRASNVSQKLAVPGKGLRNSQLNQFQQRRSGSVASGSSGGSSAGSQDGSDSRIRRKRRHKKNKKDNCLTRFRDYIAESDVFVSKDDNPPFVNCIYITLLVIPFLLILLIWDTLSVTYFEIPHLSTIEVPVFVLEFHFVCVLMVMYGYSVQILILVEDRKTSLAKISLCIHLIMFMIRVFLELYFDGYRSQVKHYVPRPGMDF